MSMVTARHDALQRELVRGASYGYTQVSNGVHRTAFCTFEGTYTATNMARVLVTREDVYYAGSLTETKQLPESARNVFPFILFPIGDAK